MSHEGMGFNPEMEMEINKQRDQYEQQLQKESTEGNLSVEDIRKIDADIENTYRDKSGVISAMYAEIDQRKVDIHTKLKATFEVNDLKRLLDEYLTTSQESTLVTDDGSDPGAHFLRGLIGGKQVEIQDTVTKNPDWDGDPASVREFHSYSGTFDDKQITPTLAKVIYRGYLGVAMQRNEAKDQVSREIDKGAT
jgi:uncharacterized protein YeeX (DUF496 family)